MLRFDYKYASVEEIADYFEKSSRASISSVRRNHRNNPEMAAKIEAAYCLYKSRQNKKVYDKKDISSLP